MTTLIIYLVIGYLIGSIPTSILVGKMARGIDIRDYGSGNAGATNVYRVLGLKLALLVFMVDAGKAATAVLLLTRLKPGDLPVHMSLLQILTGLAIIAGNIWPVWVGFAGGKGVSTSTGVLLALAPLATGCAACVWVIVVALTRYVCLASIIGSLILPLVVLMRLALFHRQIPLAIIIFTLIIPIVILITHRSNIKRLLSGTENRIGSHRDKIRQREDHIA